MVKGGSMCDGIKILITNLSWRKAKVPVHS